MSNTLPYKAPGFQARGYSENQLFDLGEKARPMLVVFSADRLVGAQAMALDEFTLELGVKIGRLDHDPDVELRRQADQLRDQRKVRLYRDDPHRLG